MYKKAALFLLLGNLILVSGSICAAQAGRIQESVVPAAAFSESSTIGVTYRSASSQRIITYETVTRLENSGNEVVTPRGDESIVQGSKSTDRGSGNIAKDSGGIVPEEGTEAALLYRLEEEDYDLLLRIVEAEAGCEDEDGRLLVANVVLNRVQNENFPDTVSEVILQKSHGVTQFSPVASGRIWKVEVSDETVQAVQKALEGEDISEGALFFAARKHADSDSMRWFDEHLTFLFRHGGHEFFR